jgi:para-nitrobenzyl esterase
MASIAKLKGRHLTTVDSQGIAYIATGVLRGIREDGVTVFRGVPFAQPPIGELRFRPPQAVQRWEGVHDATKPGHAAYQMNHVNKGNVSRIVADVDPGVPGVIAGPLSVFDTYCHNDAAEDCLYLDIWVPDTARLRSAPVYVYYHGGANIVSSGSFERERAANLARETNTVVVRPNYRLGALGWVHFGLLDIGHPEAVNLGVQDQFAALSWVHENIAAFGGDPDNITIGGESAGATAVSHLLVNPRAHPYFRRAVLQSFSPFNPWCTQQPAEAAFVAKTYLDLLHINDPADLNTIDPDRLLAAQSVVARYLPADAHAAWRPQGAVVDATWIPKTPGVQLAEDPMTKPDLEVVIGFAKDEWQFFRGHTDTVRRGSRDDVLAVLDQLFGTDGARSMYDSYRAVYPDHAPGMLLSDIMSFEYFKLPSLAIASNLSAQKIPVYLFQFSYDLPGLDGAMGATHTGDMPFLWRNHAERDLAGWPFFEGVDRSLLVQHREAISRVSATMGELYAAFIHTGEPGSTWPAFESSGWNVLWFGESVESRANLLRPEWNAYHHAGFASPGALEEALVANVRELLSAAAATKDSAPPRGGSR